MSNNGKEVISTKNLFPLVIEQRSIASEYLLGSKDCLTYELWESLRIKKGNRPKAVPFLFF